MKVVYRAALRLLNILPSVIRKSITRRMVDFSFSKRDFKDFSVKIANTEDELVQALSLVQSEYEKKKLVSNSQARITKYNLLPTVVVFVAKNKDKVVGTVSLIVDTSLGLPADKISYLSPLRRTGFRVAEISALAVDESWRKKGSVVFFALVGYCTRYAYDNVGVKFLIATINRSMKYLYQDVFLFKKLKRKKDQYDFVNDKKALPLYLDIRNFREMLYRNYNHTKTNRNVYLAIFNPIWEKHIIKEESNFDIAVRNRINANVLAKLISLNTDLVQTLTDDDKLTIENFYGFSCDREKRVLDHKKSVESRRRSKRILTNMSSVINFHHQKEKTTCYEISEHGFCLRTKLDSNVGDKIKVKVLFNNSHDTECIAKVVWKGNNRIGCEIIDESFLWMISYYNTYQEYFGKVPSLEAA